MSLPHILRTPWRRLLTLCLCVPLAAPAFDVPPAPALPAPPATARAAPAPAPAPDAAPPAAAPAPTLLIPAPLRLNYKITGRISFLPYSASGMLRWKHDGQRYDSEMEVSIFLLGSRVQTSQGRLAPGGLQPVRFVDRVHNDRTVAFDYEKRLMVFSEGTAPTPLPTGVQDQLSVFFQLAALVGAAPQRYPAGTVLNFDAVSVYGPESARFVVVGEERQSLPGGELTTVKLSRKAPRPDDPDADIWLAPALGWLPARIRLSHANGDMVDQQWRGSEAP